MTANAELPKLEDLIPLDEYDPHDEVDRIYGEMPLIDRTKFGAVAVDDLTRHVATAAYLAWTVNKRLPSATEIRMYAGGDESKIAEVTKTPVFADAMRALGVPWGSDGGLTAPQMLALQVLTNPTDRRDLKVKLKSVGVTYAQYRAWMNQPSFSQYLHKITEDALTQHIPDFNRALIEKGLKGDLNTIKYINELNGRHDPNKQAVADLKSIVSQLLEIIMSEVTDEAQLNRIASKFQLVLGTSTIKGEIGA